MDRLSTLMEQFRVRARLLHTGPLCGLQHFDAANGCGYLHVLRKGEMELRHGAGAGLPRRLKLEQPTLLFYPRPAPHTFHNPPRDGAEFTCATLDFDGGALNPLARALPPLLVLPLNSVAGLEASLGLLFAETEQLRCGQRVLADRLFEVVLVQLLRWLLDHAQEAGIQPGMITGLADPRLAAALVALHDEPGAPWTLERMAAVAGMSRTAFAVHFREQVGQTPANYVAHWRVTLAQQRLRAGRPLKLLAQELGYANPSALSRAFAALTGQSPRSWLAQVGEQDARPGGPAAK